MKFNFFKQSATSFRLRFFLDMNGTITESKRYEFKAHHHSLLYFKNKYSLEYSLPAFDAFEIKLENLFSANAFFKIEKIFSEIEPIKLEYRNYAESYFEELRKNAGLNYFIPSSINFLNNLIKNKHPVCVVSGSDRHSILRNLTLLGLENKVEFIGREDYQKPKPDPEPYLIAAKHMRITINKLNCIAVENSEYGVLSAKKAGMFTIGLARNSFLKERLVLAGADKVIHNLEEIALESAIMTSYFPKC